MIFFSNLEFILLASLFQEKSKTNSLVANETNEKKQIESQQSSQPTKTGLKSEEEKGAISELLKKRIEEIKRFSSPASSTWKASNEEAITKVQQSRPPPRQLKPTFDLDLCIENSSGKRLNDLSSKLSPLSASENNPQKRKHAESESGDDDPNAKKVKMIDDLLKIKSTHHKNVFDAEKNPLYKVRKFL